MTEISPADQYIADQAAQRAVERLMTNLGFDVENPIKTQEEMASLRRLAAKLDDEDFQEDFAFIRKLRMASKAVESSALSTIVRIVVTAALGIFLLGTKDWWLKHITG